MIKLALFGAGSRLAYEYEETCARLNIKVAFCVQNTHAPIVCGEVTAVKQLDELTSQDRETPFLVPLFTPKNRKHAVAHAKNIGFTKSVALIDPTTTLARSTVVEEGCFINAGNVIGAAGRFGAHVTINRACSIGHHALFHDFVSIGPGCTICGNVTIGQGTLIGAGTVILPGISIGENSIVGAGTVVSRDLAAHTKLIDRSAKTVLPIVSR